jgi:hypothetical protein
LATKALIRSCLCFESRLQIERHDYAVERNEPGKAGMCSQQQVESLILINFVSNAGQFRAAFGASQLESGIAVNQEFVVGYE